MGGPCVRPFRHYQFRPSRLSDRSLSLPLQTRQQRCPDSTHSRRRRYPTVLQHGVPTLTAASFGPRRSPELSRPTKRTAGPAGPRAPTALSSGGNGAMMSDTLASIQMKNA